jgi:hypothetical protein
LHLNEGMAKILRLYGVRNHATAYNSDTETYMLTLLGSQLIAANDRTEHTATEPPATKRGQEVNETETQKEHLGPDGDMLPNLDAYAEEYHRKRQTEEQPVEYPEGLSQEEIDAIGRELIEALN